MGSASGITIGRLVAVAGCSWVLLAPAGPAVASLEARCSFDPNDRALTVEPVGGTPINTISIRRGNPAEANGEAIVLTEENLNTFLPEWRPVTCEDTSSDTAYSPTVNNIDSIRLKSVWRLRLDLSQGDLVPGATPEENAESSEIEVAWDPASAASTPAYLTIASHGSSAVHWRAGALGEDLGINLNPDAEGSDTADPDIRFPETIQGALFATGDLNDEIDAGGGPEFSGPFSAEITAFLNDGSDVATAGPAPIDIEGGAGNDVIVGGPADDSLDEGAGDDLVSGGEGSDWIHAGTGDDDLNGGPGTDGLDFSKAREPARADLRLTGPQDAASFGTDTFRDFENLRGSWVADFLIGDDGPNRIHADPLGAAISGPSADLVMGEGGDDYLDGGGASDRVVGGDGDDVVRGNVGPDELVGSLGVDVLRGGKQRDRLVAADGVRDAGLDCGKPDNISEGIKRDPTDPRPTRCRKQKS